MVLLRCLIVTVILVTTASASIQDDSVVMTKFTGKIEYMDEGKYLTSYQLCDAEGNPIQAYIYNDRTYVPLRAFAKAMDRNVIWFSESNSILLSDTDRPDVYRPNREYLEFVSKDIDHDEFDDAPRISMARLLSNAEKYEGEKIRVTGPIRIEFECIRLFLTPDDMYLYNAINSVALNLNPELLNTTMRRLEKISTWYATVYGKVERDRPEEHGDFWRIVDIKYIEAVRLTDKTEGEDGSMVRVSEDPRWWLYVED